ncbi:MAG TPA: hypothetical protein VIM48_07560 [Chthoniobacterales bacterium]
MTGSPLLRATIALVLLLLLAWPLRCFTTSRTQPAAPVTTATPASKQAVHLELASTRVPFTYAVEYLGKAVWQGTSGDSSIAGDISIAFPPEGVDLVLKITWPQPGTSAARLTVTHGDTDPESQSVWGDGSATQVLTYK